MEIVAKFYKYLKIQGYVFLALIVQIKSIRNDRKAIKYLQNIVCGKKILVIGSGPSAATLKRVPSDFVIACCNLSPTLLSKKENISLYATTGYAIDGNSKIIGILNENDFKCVFLDEFPRKEIVKKENIFIRNPHSIFLHRKIINISKLLLHIKRLKKNNQHYFFSTGVQLILLSLLAGAKEVYVIGIEADDLVKYGNDITYSYDPKVKLNAHLVADQHALSQMARHNLPVFAISKNSNLANIIKYKSIDY